MLKKLLVLVVCVSMGIFGLMGCKEKSGPENTVDTMKQDAEGAAKEAADTANEATEDATKALEDATK